MKGASWVVESAGVRIFHGGESEFLPYPEAAVWDLMARGRPFDTVVDKLMLIADLDREQARSLAGACARKWAAYG